MEFVVAEADDKHIADLQIAPHTFVIDVVLQGVRNLRGLFGQFFCELC